ncbi:MAG TPA: hypothetical protein PLR94_07240 [Accumulibacter sp.]|uniref:hypothetical protein n=1 Tax=Accumulibacter sp. TaxID=2053492 RepID=UPI002CC1B181|nr:hypothetical protein [Accumulibacter sp.]HNB67475.1 hypothetical protein [Accumulibacter sp.]HNK03144.1 hypothetical protein [Accumulibacter sp.]HNL96183.1 hypothetical protein [Accumulibacter sp.]
MAKISAKPWHKVVDLRPDIRNGELSQKEFAADLYDVMMGQKRSVYHDPQEFFALTYPTARLRDLARDVVLRLAGKSEKAVRQLQLTYGGGKTHALITLVHLVAAPDDLPGLPAVEEFVTHIGMRPPRARIAALAFDRLDLETGIEVRAPDGALRRCRKPWTALAWQLGGRSGLKVLGKDDGERDTAPATNVLEELLALPARDGLASLLLLDEALMWARQAVGMHADWLGKATYFFQCLTQAAGRVPGCALVASLLASDPARSDELGKKIEKALYEVFQRVADAGVQPVERQDVAEVLRRRLLTPASYTSRGQWKQQVVSALNGICALDEQTRKSRSQAEERYLNSFPFHPDLTDVFFEKWTMLEGFQRTRGVLRTFALALREAEKWGDPSPMIGPAVLLCAPAERALTDATRELATIARIEQYDGRRQDWQAILEGELTKARQIQEEGFGLGLREIEQAVVATFLHSQPIGQRAQTRELLIMLGANGADSIDLAKGLARWAEVSWYLDDTCTAEKDGNLPKVWRLGSRPNLKQMHDDARQHILPTVLDDVLAREIAQTRCLTEGARAMGAIVHLLPSRPAEIDDDGEFHYAVLGPRAACESGKPSAEAKRFIDETTAADRPRATNRNAIVLAVPSREGIELAREKVRDMLGWEKVRELLRSRDDVDTVRFTQLEANLRVARGEMTSQVIMAYSVILTVNEANEVAAFRLSADNQPLFTRIVNDRHARIESTAVNADALLPGGPYDLWRAGESSRYVKDLVGAFAATARLPKMLNRGAILDTLLLGCEAGNFVLQVTRADRSVRTFWKARPDEVALRDPSLEVVLSGTATLTEIEPALLAPGTLPGLWKADSDNITLGDVATYFSGKHSVPVDKGGYTEPLAIPGAALTVIKDAVAAAVRAARVWLLNGPISVWGDDVPAGFLTAEALLLPPPIAALSTADLLPTSLPAAWTEPEASAHLIHASLSHKRGRVLPWPLVRQALDEAFRLGVFERTADSHDWPTDFGGAAGVKMVVRWQSSEPPAKQAYRARQLTTELRPSEIQDLADQLGELTKAAAGHQLRFSLHIQVGTDKALPDEVLTEMNRILGGIKQGMRLE